MKTKICSVKELLSDVAKYRVPLYQRSYAWEREQVQQLIDDIANSCYNKENHYYIGTLVCHQNEDYIEIIDGQQRMTTLHLINAVTKALTPTDNCNLSFDELRVEATDFLHRVYNKNLSDNSLDYRENAPQHMLYIYDEIPNMLEDVLSLYRSVTKEQWEKYFLENVQILVTYVPEFTDLNHYFEIMNSRGEQLELHEILKARLLDCLRDNESEQQFISQTWNLCSEMNFDTLPEDKSFSHYASNGLTLTEILAQPGDENMQVREDPCLNDGNKYRNRVIDFPNFLMIALRLFLKERGGDFLSIPLDDKQLLNSYDKLLLKIDNQCATEHIIAYGHFLKALYDKFINYIIHRDSGRWAIGTVMQESSQTKDERRIIALQTLFHSSYPAMRYKYWLYHALSSDENYLSSLDFWESMAKHYLSGRYGSNIIGYENIMDTEISPKISEIRLRYSQPIVFALKLYDYLLWVDAGATSSLIFSTDQNSVEHFYPQHPGEGKLELCPSVIHQFGNLCLISSGMNSRFTNNLPDSKRIQFSDLQHNSLKLKEMMSSSSDWTANVNCSIQCPVCCTIIRMTNEAIHKFQNFLG